MRLKRILIAIALIIMFGIIGMTARLFMEAHKSQKISRFVSEPVTAVGPCPPSPNCVSTSASPRDEIHFIETPKFKTNPLPEIKRIFEQLNITITQHGPTYVVGTHKSGVFGFVDDIDLVWSPGTSKLLMRSASRVGHSDLGANRRRIKGIVFLLRQAGY